MWLPCLVRTKILTIANEKSSRGLQLQLQPRLRTVKIASYFYFQNALFLTSQEQYFPLDERVEYVGKREIISSGSN